MLHKTAQLTGHNAAIYKLVPGLEKGHFLSASGEGWIVDWDPCKPELGKLVAQSDRQIFSLLAIPDQELILAGNLEGYLNWADLKDADASRKILMHPGGIFGLGEQENLLYVLGGDGLLSLWNLKTRMALESLRLSSKSLRSFSFHPTEALLAIGASDGNIYIVDLKDFELRSVISEAHGNSVFSLAFSLDGKQLLSGGRDALLKCWTFREGKAELQESINAHWFTINDIAFHPKGHLFATASRDKTLKIWDTRSLKLIKVLEGIRDGGHVNSINTLLWLGGGKLLASAGDDRVVILWKFS